MKIRHSALFFAVLFYFSVSLFAQTEGVKLINVDEMKFHLQFLGAKEFNGRNTPSTALDIASKYIAMYAEKYGLKPLMQNGSYYQEIQVEVTSPSQKNTSLTINSGTNLKKYSFPEDFGVSMRSSVTGNYSGEPVFLGFGLSSAELNWEDIGKIDLKGKIVIVLDPQLPPTHILDPSKNRMILFGRSVRLKEKGAVAVINIINSDREKNFKEKDISFDINERLKYLNLELDQNVSGFPILEIRHKTAAEMLGITKEEIEKMLQTVIEGKQVPAKEFPGSKLDISLDMITKKSKTYNVVGYLEGSDPILKSEYVSICSHHDHLGVREGKILPGSDDNASGCVAMFELAKALKVEKPKRSIIFIWNTAEEKGLIGSYYFVQHCPVPVEKITSNLNLDMITRNETNSLYIIGSNKLSSDFDKSINSMNDKYVKMKLDYKYENPLHPDRFFFRSDQLPYIRYGIPGVWFFCGTTDDYHQETDIVERADFVKMEKSTKLVYYTALDNANRPDILKLDVNPKIATRGKHNFNYNWQQK